MKNRKNSLALSLIILLGVLMNSCIYDAPEHLKRAVQLRGLWKFSVGDDSAWSATGFDDSAWDEILVPSRWENEGYDDYNGYAWYRRTFTMPPVSKDHSVYLMLGRIDDVDEVYVNGLRVGGRGKFPPDYITAYNEDRKYYIPQDYLNFDAENTIAVRVYDSYLEGGIISSPAGIYLDENAEYIDMSLSGVWRFKTGDNKQWKTTELDDSAWIDMKVPSEWENEGFVDYDGYAWFRKEFVLPNNLKGHQLYLSLGKIDDYDYVYLNGKEIGNVFELDHDGEYKFSGFEYNARRVYKIPHDLIDEDGTNLIAIRVYDKTLRGGIYEGPIGLMTRDNYKKYSKKHKSHQSFGEFIADIFIDE